MGLSSVFVCLSSSAVFYRPIRLQARTVIQQCSHAKIKLKPAVDGADAQWAEVGAFVFQCILFNYVFVLSWKCNNHVLLPTALDFGVLLSYI